MSTCEPQGQPFSAPSHEPVDAWSRLIFDRRSSWPPALEGGRWHRYEPGHLVLLIERAGGDEIDPAAIETTNEELTVAFGGWHAHLPDEGANGDGDKDAAVAEAQDLVARWIDGRARTAIFTDENGKWCGTVFLDPGEPTLQLEDSAKSFREFHPTNVELLSAWRADWQRFSVRGGKVEAEV